MGLIVLDAGVMIAFFEETDTHHSAAKQALRTNQAEGHLMHLPISAYAEMLVSPYKRDAESVALVDEAVDRLPATIAPVTRQIAHSAAQLRARHGRGLRLPDALVIGTAIVLMADRILTTDRRWPDVGVEITIIR